jgi:hypothetical protein
MAPASQVYSRLLLPYAHGVPLWKPEPDSDLPPEYLETGILVGDVGILTPEGGFDYLFNICYPANHPVNNRGVPEEFIPIERSSLNIPTYPHHNPKTDFTSQTIKKVELQGDVHVS